MPLTKPTFRPPLAEYELDAAEAAESAYGLTSGKAATMTRLITDYLRRQCDIDEVTDEYGPEQTAKIYDDTFFLFFGLAAAKRGITPATFADRESARVLSASDAANDF